MLATHSVAISPLQPDEVAGLRGLARSERDFASAACRASRLTFLSAASRGLLDPEAALGLGLSEADAIVALARTPAGMAAEREWKLALVRSWREGGGGGRLLDAMLDAALEADRPLPVENVVRAGRGRERS